MLKKIMLTALSIMILSSTFPLCQATGTATTLSVTPQGIYGLSPSQTFSINITVSNVTDLYAWQFRLYYQSAVLNATTRTEAGSQVPNIDEGPFLSTGAPQGTFFYIANFTDHYNATYGLIYVACSRIGNTSGVSGSGTLVTIGFKAIGSGASILHLARTKLVDSVQPFGNLIPHTPIDGQAYVGSVDVAISKIDTPINIPKGSVATINVTAQNKGSITETFDVTLLYNGTNPIDGTKTVLNLLGGRSQILPFALDTTVLPTGEYDLTATATKVPGELDLSDNTLSLKVYIGIRDLAITNVKPSITSAPVGRPIDVNVTVQNNGQATETPNVTLYYASNVIGTDLITLLSGAYKTITFTWNTTGVVIGTYTISAYAHPLPYETNTADNNLTGGTINIVSSPDVAVTNVEHSKDIVGQGFTMHVEATVKNIGPLTETFNVTAYANTTTIQTVTLTLASGSSKNLTFTWDTRGFAKGNYTISAYAHPLPYETDIENNNLTALGKIRVVMAGDADLDKVITIIDVVRVTGIYGAMKGRDKNYDPNMDWNDDGIINILDVVIVTGRYAQKDP